MTKLWTASEVLGATVGNAVNNVSWSAAGVSIDSRTVKEGDLFVAIVGPNKDGHDYLRAAFDRGAAAAVVTRVPTDVEDKPLVRVDDTLRSLCDLGRVARERSRARVIAVTGSVGKTGTKDALNAAFARERTTHSTLGSQNNQWGVPLSLARLPRDTEVAIFEIGMSHSGEIAPLSRLVAPHLAIITAVEPGHLEYFDSVDGIADAKAEIFLGLQPGGIAIINCDNPYFNRLTAAAKVAGAQVIGFGESHAAGARLIKYVAKPHCSCMSADICGQPMAVKVGVPGRHIVQNSLAVLAAVHAFGGDLGLAGLALAELRPPAGRGNRSIVKLDVGSFQLIDESYNANPASMRAAIRSLGTLSPDGVGRRIAVLGDMLELGLESPLFHSELSEELGAASVDLVFCAGSNMLHLFEELPAGIAGGWYSSAKDLIPRLISEIRPDDVIMVKGSLGSRMGSVVEALMGIEAHMLQQANGF